jgi:hypothetical protein
MTGFQHDPLADVNLIADNLRDRYKDRFSILKELLQNADDARAEEIRFGVLPGIPGSAHPLLRSPGLVVINDGIFKESDYSAILRFGLNEKAAEPATIGKFGLGMKSVFHLSEAFLFMAETEGSTYRELVSPWGEDFHSDWGLSETEWHQLRRDALFSVCWNSASKPFILYLPLRQEAQLRLPDGRIAGAIIEDYAGDTGAVTSLLAYSERCRSAFRGDGDRDSELMPITIPR